MIDVIKQNHITLRIFTPTVDVWIYGSGSVELEGDSKTLLYETLTKEQWKEIRDFIDEKILNNSLAKVTPDWNEYSLNEKDGLENWD